MDFFPERGENDDIKIFEKSATYFESTGSEIKIQAMLPGAQLIAVLLEPGERAYSWYQHQRAHGIEEALAYSFYQILQTQKSNTSLYKMKQRCLEPGLYAKNLERWFDKFSDDQVVIVDGNRLKTDPIPLMNSLQKELNVKFYDYKKLIAYDEHKGYYCPLDEDGNTKCLGKGKVISVPNSYERARRRSVFRNLFFVITNTRSSYISPILITFCRKN